MILDQHSQPFAHDKLIVNNEDAYLVGSWFHEKPCTGSLPCYKLVATEVFAYLYGRILRFFKDGHGTILLQGFNLT
jgi:hypothetical protein